MPRTRFKNPVWYTVLAMIGAAASLAAALRTGDIQPPWVTILFYGFAALCVAAAADCLTAYLRLDNDTLLLRANFRTRRINKSDIESVSWAGGCPVTLTLKDGRHIRLPSFGQHSQGLTNSIRAWLKRG